MFPPSIPTDNLGYKYTEDNAVEKVMQKKARAPVPGSYEIRTDLIKQTGIAWSINPTISRKEDETVAPGPGAYNLPTERNNPKAPSSCFNSEYDRFNPKKITKVLKPGPGDYIIQDNRLNRQFS